MNRSLAYVLAAVVVIGGAGAWWMNRPAGTSFDIGVANAQAADADLSLVQEMSLGNPDAAVTVIEYASFTCPHCASFHQGVLKQIKSDYVDTGKINFIYREVYFDRFGLWAGMVARCGGPVKYFGIADLIYTQQKDWIGDGDPANITANLRTIGKTAGLTDEELDGCLNDSEKAKALVAVFQENAKADSVNSTPSFVINGKKFANMNFADFSAAIDSELGG